MARNLKFSLTAIVCVVLSLCAVTDGTTPVEELEQVIPESTFAFAATSGTNSVKSAFEKSSLGQIWNDPAVQDFYKAVKPQLTAALRNSVTQDDPNTMKAYDAVMNLAKLIIQRPVIVGVADNNGSEEVPVCGYVMVNAGADKNEIAAAMKDIEALADEGDISETRIPDRPGFIEGSRRVQVFSR